MGCIEMNIVHHGKENRHGLIETWDVLKWVYPCTRPWGRVRLIETWDVLKSTNIIKTRNR